MNAKMRISLVIPVYNEVDRIHDCLTAVARQTVRPFEVIVVNNNSTDGTIAIARAFPFVRIITEDRQGVVYARDAGFAAARGDVIARIDADTVIPSNWIATLKAVFADSATDAVSGTVAYRDIALPHVVSRIDLFWRRRMARLLGRDVALQGANMAMRTAVWTVVQSQLCHERGLHEDFDVAIHATKAGFNVRFDERVHAAVCYRQANYNFASFSRYALISPRTYLKHGVKSGRHMYQVVLFVIMLYPIISVLSRGYDERLGRFSFAKLFTATPPPRVNPATFVD
jgi:glycosyltransferase involved in cell wall biosynthesis